MKDDQIKTVTYANAAFGLTSWWNGMLLVMRRLSTSSTILNSVISEGVGGGERREGRGRGGRCDVEGRGGTAGEVRVGSSDEGGGTGGEVRGGSSDEGGGGRGDGEGGGGTGGGVRGGRCDVAGGGGTGGGVRWR